MTYRNLTPNGQRRADLVPPLGGGPCTIVDRINSRINNPTLREDLVEDVQGGVSLPNEDARKVYQLDKEVGSPFGTFSITPHAQYRMDLRKVKVKHVEFALDSFFKRLQELQSKGRSIDSILAEPVIKWLDERLGLVVVFGMDHNRNVSIITSYWKNRKDPPPTVCSPSRVANRFLGYSQTRE